MVPLWLQVSSGRVQARWATQYFESVFESLNNRAQGRYMMSGACVSSRSQLEYLRGPSIPIPSVPNRFLERLYVYTSELKTQSTILQLLAKITQWTRETSPITALRE